MNKSYLESFLTSTFLIAVGLLILMMIIVALGNPKTGNFYWHYVLEIAAIYFIGSWSFQQKYSLKEVIGLYLLITFTVPLFTGVSYFSGIVLGAVLGFPIFLGYDAAKQDAKIIANDENS